MIDILHFIDRRTASFNKWTFVMLSPAQNRAVVQFLRHESKRPLQALEVWALCFEYLNPDTGEIMLRRAEIAEMLSIRVNSVSQIMAELRKRNAILTRRGANTVRYFMNPNVATHLAGKARDSAQQTAGAVLMPEPRQQRLQLVT